MQHHLSSAGNQPGKGGRFDDPQSLLFLSARYLEYSRVRNYSPHGLPHGRYSGLLPQVL